MTIERKTVWYCLLCGKWSPSKYGSTAGGPATDGWDESCMLNAVEVVMSERVRRAIMQASGIDPDQQCVGCGFKNKECSCD